MGITFSTGVKYSATPSAVPFTEFITLCIVDNSYAAISERDELADRQADSPMRGCGEGDNDVVQPGLISRPRRKILSFSRRDARSVIPSFLRLTGSIRVQTKWHANLIRWVTTADHRGIREVSRQTRRSRADQTLLPTVAATNRIP